MATSHIPGPLGHDLKLAGAKGSLWCDVGCHRGHTPGPIRVADATQDKPKNPAPAPVTIIFHVYVSTFAPPQKGDPQGFNIDNYKDWFNAAYDTRDLRSRGKWDTENVYVEWNTIGKTGVADFEKSLKRDGAIVVYIGHSSLTPPKEHPGPSLGLTPQGKDQPEIPNATLRNWLSKSTASLVIIGSCDSKTAVGKINAGPDIIVTNSKKNRVTDISRMARGAGTFLFLLIGWELTKAGQPDNSHKSGHGTINEALAASAEAFGTDTPDRFELVHGDGSIKLIPERSRP
jgi:hypothetical protein